MYVKIIKFHLNMLYNQHKVELKCIIEQLHRSVSNFARHGAIPMVSEQLRMSWSNSGVRRATSSAMEQIQWSVSNFARHGATPSVIEQLRRSRSKSGGHLVTSGAMEQFLRLMIIFSLI